MKIYKVEWRGRREGYTNENQWVGWAKPGDPATQRRYPNWKPICYEQYCKNCGFYKCSGCDQNPTNLVCEDCQAPHYAHECLKSVENQVIRKKAETEYRRLIEEDMLIRGEGLLEDVITELKDGRYRHLSPHEIDKMLRVRRQGERTEDNRPMASEEPVISFE